MRFPRLFLLSLSLLMLLLAGSSVLVDPYGAFRSTRIEGLNQYKPTALPFMRLVKPYHVNWLDYDVLVTGSSRAGRGIDCEYFLRRGQTCYNAGLTGGGTGFFAGKGGFTTAFAGFSATNPSAAGPSSPTAGMGAPAGFSPGTVLVGSRLKSMTTAVSAS